MTAAEGTARWQAVEQVREALALHRSIGASGEHLTRRSDDALVAALAALSLLEQLAEAATAMLIATNGECPLCAPLNKWGHTTTCPLDAALAAVRAGRGA